MNSIPSKQGEVDMKLEVIVIPVTDVDRAKEFYTRLGWRLDIDFVWSEESRAVQMTPPGSPCSIHFGKGLTRASPGSAQSVYLVVSDIDAARAELKSRGIEVSDLFHRTPNDGKLHPGPSPDRSSYFTYMSFNDPDGNSWLVQEVTQRFPGRVEAEAKYVSARELAGALRRAAAAHGEHEARSGKKDENWPEWYAEYLFHEQVAEKKAA